MLLGSWRRRRARLVVADLCLQLVVKDTDLVGQEHEMQQHVGVHDHEDRRTEHEESEQRQIDVEERQLDRVLEEQVLMRDAAGRDGEVEKHEQIADPQSRAHARGLDHRALQGGKILRPLEKLGRRGVRCSRGLGSRLGLICHWHAPFLQHTTAVARGKEAGPSQVAMCRPSMMSKR